MRRERRLPAKPDAVRDGAGTAFARAGADELALELGQAAEHREHQAAVRRGGGPRVTERSEAGSFVGDRRQDVEKVARRSRQAIETGDQEHVAGVARNFVHDAAAASGQSRRFLGAFPMSAPPQTAASHRSAAWL
jgi:hypothetical protein